MNRTLVIVICQTRGHSTVWPTFKKNVIDTLNADLALCVSRTNQSDHFRENADYIWEYDDYLDWMDAYKLIQKELNSSVDWTSILDIDKGRDSCLFGGIKHPHVIGSGAILFYYRWRLLENIHNLGLKDKYDWFIITRSDYMYDIPHVPVEYLSKNSVWIPNGERYGGVTDRHLICPSEYIEPCIDMLKYMLTEPTHFCKYYKDHLQGKGANPETFIDYYLRKQEIKVKFIPYFMYTIRELDEISNPTRHGAAGEVRYESTDYGLKYPEEKRIADKLTIQQASDWKKYISTI